MEAIDIKSLAAFYLIYHQTRDSQLWADGLYQYMIFLDDIPFKERLRQQFDFYTKSEILESAKDLKAKVLEQEFYTDGAYLKAVLEVYNGINKL